MEIILNLFKVILPAITTGLFTFLLPNILIIGIDQSIKLKLLTTEFTTHYLE